MRGIEPHPERLLQLYCIVSDLVDFILTNTKEFATQRITSSKILMKAIRYLK